LDFNILSISTLCISIVAVILTYVDMRRRLKQEREFSMSMADLINTLREELEIFRKQSITSGKSKRQQLLAQREDKQWSRMKDVAKAIGWMLEHSQEEEE
jgi:hypothetical protein